MIQPGLIQPGLPCSNCASTSSVVHADASLQPLTMRSVALDMLASSACIDLYLDVRTGTCIQGCVDRSMRRQTHPDGPTHVLILGGFPARRSVLPQGSRAVRGCCGAARGSLPREMCYDGVDDDRAVEAAVRAAQMAKEQQAWRTRDARVDARARLDCAELLLAQGPRSSPGPGCRRSGPLPHRSRALSRAAERARGL